MKPEIQDLIDGIKLDDSLSQKAIDAFMKTIVPSLEAGETFSGFDCECDSWDGLSNRCECGNRRLYWSNMDDDIWYPQTD
jgi:hypothetical protein